MKNVSASKIALLRECRYWARDEVPHRASTGAAASRGTLVHAMLEAYLLGQERPKTDDIEAVAMFQQGVAWAVLNVAPGAKAEVAYAWDPATDRGWCLQPAIERWLSDHPGTPRARLYADAEAWPWIAGVVGCPVSAITMTLDVLEARGLDTVISDWCTGRTDKFYQLAINALAVARAHCLSFVQTRAVHITAEGVTVSAYAFDRAVLDGLAQDLKYLTLEIPLSKPEPGEHCSGLYCPAVNACPSAQALIPASALTVRYPFSAEIQGQEHAQALIGMVALAKAFVSEVDAALKAHAREHGGVPMPDGKVWQETFRTMPRVDKDATQALFVELGATPEQIASCIQPRQESAGFRAVKPDGGVFADRPKAPKKARPEPKGEEVKP